DFETRVDSAAGYFPPPGNTDGSEVSATLSGEALLHFRPGLQLELPGSKLAVDLRGYIDYVHYTGLLTPGSTNNSHLEGLADLTLNFNQHAPVSLVLADHFERSDRTRSVAIGAGLLSLYNEVRLGMPLKPGGGAISVTPELSWGFERFKPLAAMFPVGCDSLVCDPAAVNQFDYSNLRASLGARWRFLPKTAVVVDTQFNYRDYTWGSTPEALLLSTRLGLAGLVSPKIAMTALVGWGQDFGATASGTFLAQLEGTYMLSQTASVKVGYTRALEPVAIFGLFRDDRGYLEGQALLGGRLTLRGMVAFDYLSFQGTRRDRLFKVDIGPQYQFQRWLIGGVGYLLGLRSSNEPGAGINYTRHEGYVRMTVSY
ncbi:hypothetical protein, partial [Archangium sp.]|uniref:hypothetical protein n=1 Tax=Archangium sp. TaxID=1872627 RepID=UPI002EDB8083